MRPISQICLRERVNQDNYTDILLAKESFATVVYGGPNFSREFSLASINGTNGFNITLSSSRIEHIIGVGDIDGKYTPDFAIAYGSSKYYIITKDLPKATACIDADYCLKQEAHRYADSILFSSSDTIRYYNLAIEGTYNKASQSVIDKDVMSASTAALCGITMGAVASVGLIFIGNKVKNWYKEGIYVELEEQELNWSSDSRRARIYEIEEVMSEKFKCYQYLLCFFFVFKLLGIATLIAGKEALDLQVFLRILLYGLKAIAYGRAIEAYRRGTLERQKRVVLIMKVLLVLACFFLAFGTKIRYQEVKIKWENPETGFMFALDVIFNAFVHVGIHLVIYLYARKFLKLMIKRDKLRSQRRQESNPVEIENRGESENM